MNNKLPIVLITGASDGIGCYLARLYHKKGHKVIATGRRSFSNITPALPKEIEYISADLATASGLADLVSNVGSRPITLLIQNAGVGWYGPLADQSISSIQSVIETNLTAPMEITQALQANLLAGGGKVVFIGSSAVATATPQFACYTASKAALTGLARSLALEWSGQIGVQIIHPCPTATDMHAKVGMKPSKMTRLFPSPKTVAVAIVRKVQNGKDHRFGVGFILRHAISSWRAST
jgi:short-subunit dehydrogenase